MSTASSPTAKPVLQVHHLSISYETHRVLVDVSLSLSRGEVVAVVGPNGSGKSTLLRCVLGKIRPDAGTVQMPRGTAVSYLPQVEAPDLDKTVEERIWSYQHDLDDLRQRIQGGAYELVREYETLGGYDRERQIHLNARDLGLGEVLQQRLGELSLGQRRKADLAGVLVSGAELLVLDEPVNYLDLRGITAFEEAVKALKLGGTSILLVSHDRELVDNLAERTLFLEGGSVVSVQGGYSQALDHRHRELQARRHQARDVERKLRALETDMRRRMGWATRTERSKRGAAMEKPRIAKRAKKMMQRAKAVEKRLEQKRAELESIKPRLEKPVHLAFPQYHVRHRLVARLQGACKSFSGSTVLRDVTLSLHTRDRFALIGDNGAGKTTLLKLVAGDIQPNRGESYHNPAVRIGRVPQGLDGFFEHRVLLDNLLVCGQPEAQVRTFLGAAKLRRDKALQTVSSLSFGERMRGAIVKLILKHCDFLILDEPTTHLDVESLEVLQDLLHQFAGGFLLVTHDRRLIGQVCDEILMLEGGRLERV